MFKGSANLSPSGNVGDRKDEELRTASVVKDGFDGVLWCAQQNCLTLYGISDHSRPMSLQAVESQSYPTQLQTYK